MTVITSDDYAKMTISYLKKHKYGEWSALMKALDNPNPNTLNFVLHKLRFSNKIELFEAWRLKLPKKENKK